MGVTRSGKKPVGGRSRVPPPAPRRPNVFRCPSPSPSPPPQRKKREPAPAPVAGPAPAVVAKNPQSRERKSAPKKHADLVKAVGVAFHKKRAKERAAGGPIRKLAEPWVAVGNLDPETTEAQLKEHFAHAGTVESASIRYSTGAIDQHTRLPGYTYALVYFRSRAAAHDALLLNGTRVGESTYDIVVESALDALPEIRRLEAAAIVSSKAGRSNNVNQSAVRQTACGPVASSALKVEKTKVWSQRPDVQARLKRDKGKVHLWAGTEFTLTLA